MIKCSPPAAPSVTNVHQSQLRQTGDGSPIIPQHVPVSDGTFHTSELSHDGSIISLQVLSELAVAVAVESITR